MDKLSESDMNEYRDAFTLFDTKFEGVIPAIEVGNLCRALGINPKQSDVKKLTGRNYFLNSIFIKLNRSNTHSISKK